MHKPSIPLLGILFCAFTAPLLADEMEQARARFGAMRERFGDQQELAAAFQGSSDLSAPAQEAMLRAALADRASLRTGFRTALGRAVTAEMAGSGATESTLRRAAAELRAQLEEELAAPQQEGRTIDVAGMIAAVEEEFRADPSLLLSQNDELAELAERAAHCNDLSRWIDQRLRPSGKRPKDDWEDCEPYLTATFAMPVPPLDREKMVGNRRVAEEMGDFRALEFARRFNVTRILLGGAAVPLDPDLSLIAREHLTVVGDELSPIQQGGEEGRPDPFDRSPKFSRYTMEQHLLAGSEEAEDVILSWLPRGLLLRSMLDPSVNAIGVGRIDARWMVIVQKTPQN